MSHHRSATRAAATALLAVLTAAVPAAAAHASAAPVRATPSSAGALHQPAAYMQTLLIFGTVRPDGGPDVTREQFWEFVDRVVTPRFPDGLTVTDAQGQWRDRHGVIERERSYEIYLLYPASQAAEKSVAIDEIRELYKRCFAQEAVARVDEQAQVDF